VKNVARKWLLLLEVELMETLYLREWVEKTNEVAEMASIIGSGINGNLLFPRRKMAN